MTTRSASLSDLGRRKNNEDFAAYFEPTDPIELQQSGCLYIVADGVGGAAKGERASQFAAQKLLFDYYQPENAEVDPLERMRLIMEQANNNIYAHASENHTRMATTIVAAVVRGGLLYVANVGDSRAYLIRSGNVTQINRDHSIVGELTEQGDMTEAEAMTSKVKNRLTRSLGGDPEVSVSVYAPLPLQNGDKILLCSDGLTRYASRELIAKMTAQGSNEEIAEQLVKFANKSGGADNTTVIVVSYVDQGVLDPAVLIVRPKQVDLDTLVTDQGVKVNNYKRDRKPIVTVTWLIILVGGVVSAILLGGILGNLAVKLSPVVLPTSTPVTPTPTPDASTSITVTTPTITVIPTSTPLTTPTITVTPTSTPLTTPTITFTSTNSPLTKQIITDMCKIPIFIHVNPGKDQPPVMGDDGKYLFVEFNNKISLIGKRRLEETTGDNPEGYWLQIYPQGKEVPGWISNENCLELSPEILNSLPDK
jgi:serine/threonine protein phosphatase PrpC